MAVLVNDAGATIDVPDTVAEDYLQQGWQRPGLPADSLADQNGDDVPEKPKARSRRSGK